MSRQVTKDTMRGPKARRSDRRIVHALLTPASDSDLAYIIAAYRALTLSPTNQSQVIRRALNLLAQRLAGLHGLDAAKAEIEALKGERVAV